METPDLSAGIATAVRTYATNGTSSTTGTAIVGHNGHPIAAKLARIWIRHMKRYHSNVCYIDLSTPTICQYARIMEQATQSYWLCVEQKGQSVIVNLVIQQDGEDQTVSLFEDVSIEQAKECESISIETLSCKYTPTYIADYFQSVLEGCSDMKRVRRSRIHVAIGFDNSLYSRFVIGFLNTLGCKVFPLLEHVQVDELSRIVQKRRLSFGVIFDEHLNIRTFVDETGESIRGVLPDESDVQTSLIRTLLAQKQRNEALHSSIAKGFDIDGVWVLLQLLDWVSAIELPVSQLIYLGDRSSAVPFTAAVNRIAVTTSDYYAAQSSNDTK